MKFSIALGARHPISRSIAWGCLTSNLALPGSGSLFAGRKSGYAQLAVGVTGLLVSTICGMQFILWQLANWSRFHGPGVEPDLLEMWLHLRWALAGFGIFFIALIWALMTSFSILEAARKTGPPPLPPPLDARSS